MTLMRAQSVTIEWPDGSKDTWESVTVDDHVTGQGGTHPASPEATGIKYKVIVLMEGKIVGHEPPPTEDES